MATLTKKDLFRAFVQGFLRGFRQKNDDPAPTLKQIQELFEDFYVPKKAKDKPWEPGPRDVPLDFGEGWKE